MLKGDTSIEVSKSIKKLLPNDILGKSLKETQHNIRGVFFIPNQIMHKLFNPNPNIESRKRARDIGVHGERTKCVVTSENNLGAISSLVRSPGASRACATFAISMLGIGFKAGSDNFDYIMGLDSSPYTIIECLP